jgi:hypothetical protein
VSNFDTWLSGDRAELLQPREKIVEKRKNHAMLARSLHENSSRRPTMLSLAALDLNGAMLIAGTAVIIALCVIAALPRGRSRLQFQSTKRGPATKNN